MSDDIFWAEQLAKKIKERKKFRFLEKNITEEFFKKKLTVKSSSSLSGVLHIGRLSDIIRGEAVYRALKNEGLNVDFIYVTEDMDPLRSIPKGIPQSFEEYIGFPVSDVPDPFGCHNSYRDHFLEEFLTVFNEFLYFEPKVYSMREEYKKGSFTNAIKKIIEKKDLLLEILNKEKQEKLGKNYSFWKPVCDNCGNLQTTIVTEILGDKVKYKCQDYEFEKYTAKGCGYEGINDITKGNGKLVWKSEWAAQWQHWNVCSEGAGKEYIAPNSAFWINAEICERILDFPAPEPIFYEHLTIEGTKMSASVGNVIYPKEWLEVARPEALKYLYLKKLMKTRSFSWKNLPMLELELDRIIETAEQVREKQTKTKEEIMAEKFLEYTRIKGRKIMPLKADYSLIAGLSQLYSNEEQIIKALTEIGHLNEKTTKEELMLLKERINNAKKWIEKYAPEERLAFTLEVKKEKKVDEKTAIAIKEFLNALNEKMSSEEIQALFFAVAKKHNMNLSNFFKLFYEIIIEKNAGPKLGTLIKAIGIEKVKEKLEKTIKT